MPSPVLAQSLTIRFCKGSETPNAWRKYCSIISAYLAWVGGCEFVGVRVPNTQGTDAHESLAYKSSERGGISTDACRRESLTVRLESKENKMYKSLFQFTLMVASGLSFMAMIGSIYFWRNFEVIVGAVDDEAKVALILGNATVFGMCVLFMWSYVYEILSDKSNG